MNCIDEKENPWLTRKHVINKICAEVDKATKHLYDDNQLHQIIASMVESRINRHIIDTTHELLLKNIDNLIEHELKAVINEMDINTVIRHAAISYYYSDEFKSCLKSLTKYCDYKDYSKDITLREIASLYKNDDDYHEDE